MVMDKLGHAVSKYPIVTIVIVLLITFGALGSIIINGIEQEFSEESFLPDLEIAKASDEISEEYTATRSVSILVKSKNGDLLTSEALTDMLEVQKEIVNDPEIQPTLENPLMPFINANSVANVIAQMILVQQNVQFPSMDAMISTIQNMNDDQIKQTITGILMSNQTPLEVKGMFTYLLTKDFDVESGDIVAKGTMISISLNASLEGGSGEGVAAHDFSISNTEQRMFEIAKDTEAVEFTVLGSSIIMEEIMDANNASMMILLPMAFGFVIVILAIIYRSGFDMLFSLLALLFAIIWVYGFGAAMGYSFNPITTAVPILIVGLGIDYGIHVTMRYREEIKSGKKIKKSINITIQSVGMALLLATVTTVIAFLSNLSSPIGLLGEFGVLSAIGIIGSFITMTTFVPAVKQIRDLKKLEKEKASGKRDKQKNKKAKKKGNNFSTVSEKVLNKTIGSGAVVASRSPIAVIIVVSLLTIGATGLAMQLQTTFNFEDFLPEDLDISKDLDFMLNEFEIPGGEAEEVNILVKGDISDPDLLRAIDETVDNMADDKSVLKQGTEPDVETILSFMRDWATNSTAYGTIDQNYDPTFEIMYNDVMTSEGVPNSGATKSNITLLYNWLCINPGSCKGINYYLDKTDDGDFEGTVIRISVDADFNDNEEMDELINDLEDDKKPLDDVADKAIVTSGPILTKVIMDLLNESQIRSLIITIIVSLIVLTIVFYYKWRSFILGVLTITPVIFCVLWTLATMYLVDIPLNVMTITIASLTVGLGITYGIHVTHRFLEDIERHDTIDDAAMTTVTHTGTALFGAAATTIAGFGLLVFALMPPLQQFGGITALTILYSFLSSVFILPTFLVIWAKWRVKREGESDLKNHNNKGKNQD
jgi:predicted RND superfamily exporter protein